ncbi:hypothetical protein [Mongoliitalea lutea]|uniref:Uncharacterized protein n=1 Tax=Mongoliitalea lutea TaxID=849756 RepID=A0A8J3G7E1_9BACT|nr:hypothetical protein [Mongoliitalea lutea]GHB51053.1 hypothetical protein GCM10008106_34800 [Mongoliitalea lutea]
MKHLMLWAIVGLVMTAWSCNPTENVDPTSMQGQFAGTFERTVNGQSEGVANVGLILEGNSFSGSGGPNRYPVICNGTFTVSGGNITFENACFFTADFDWSLILSGSFRLSRVGGEYILQRSNDNLVDTYRLRRVEANN